MKAMLSLNLRRRCVKGVMKTRILEHEIYFRNARFISFQSIFRPARAQFDALIYKRNTCVSLNADSETYV